MGEAVPKPSYPKPLRFRAGAFIGTGTRPENLGADEAVHRDPIDGNGAAPLRPAGQAKAGVATPQSTPSAQRPIAAEIKGRNGPPMV